MTNHFNLGIVLSLALLAAPFTQAFVYYPVGNNPLRWNVNANIAHTNIVNPATKSVRYYIASDAWSTANRDREIEAVRACFDQWQSVTGSNLKFEFAGFISAQGLDVKQDNTNVVFWAKSNLRVNNGTFNLTGIPAWTSVNFAEDGSILEADIVLNGLDYRWFTDIRNTASKELFIEAVLLHEIGHFVGLDHTLCGGATVIRGANGISTESGLSSDEICAMRFLYPAPGSNTGEIRGTVRLDGTPLLGATVVAEDAAGNVANATVSRANGFYHLPGLAPGTYRLRACPLDPANAGVEKLFQGRDVAPEYASAYTAFAATPNQDVTVTVSNPVITDFNVSSGPPFRISSISIPTPIFNLVSVSRAAVVLKPGDKDIFLGVSGPNIPSDAILTISGDGLTLGPSSFTQDRWGPNLNSLITRVTVSSYATPGLRSFVISHSTGVAYANGYLEISTPVMDYNFDGLDDLFQRDFWRPWTIAAAAPTADPDADNFSNAFEYRTGTSPVDPASHHLAITHVQSTGEATVITWNSDPGKRYQLHSRTSLISGEWQPLGRAFTATATQMVQEDFSPGEARFYRLQLLP